MVRETWVQSQVASYQKLLKCFLIPPCLTLCNISYVSRVKWSNPGKRVAPSPTNRYSSFWKWNLLVAFDYGCNLFLLFFTLISSRRAERNSVWKMSRFSSAKKNKTSWSEREETDLELSFSFSIVVLTLAHPLFFFFCFFFSTALQCVWNSFVKLIPKYSRNFRLSSDRRGWCSTVVFTSSCLADNYYPVFSPAPSHIKGFSIWVSFGQKEPLANSLLIHFYF